MNQVLVDYLESSLGEFCKKHNFDIAILMEINGSQLIVKKLFGDPFARPDLTEDKVLKNAGTLYLNEFELLKGEKEISNIPTTGWGADCGIRLKNSNFIIVFDDVVGDPELTTDSEQDLLKIKSEAESHII